MGRRTDMNFDLEWSMETLEDEAATSRLPWVRHEALRLLNRPHTEAERLDFIRRVTLAYMNEHDASASPGSASYGTLLGMVGVPSPSV
jgi:hypothetical protein